MAYGNNGGYAGGNNRYQPQNRQQAAPYNNTPRQSQQEPQISSQGPTLFNDKASKFLNINYWGRYTSIEIGVIPMGSSLDWNNRKNAQRVSQVIGFGDLSDLQEICEEVMDSLKNTGTFTSSGIRVGVRQDSIVEINNGSSLNLQPGIYLVLYKNVDSNNRTNNLEYYPFGHVKLMRGYDHGAGTYKEEVSKIGEFKKFYKSIKESCKAFTMAQAHAVNVSQKTDRIACFKALAAMTTALGVDMAAELKHIYDAPKGGNGGGNRQGGGGNRNGGYGASRNAPRSSAFEAGNTGGNNANFQRQQQILSTLDDPVDINLSMDSLTNIDMSKFS